MANTGQAVTAMLKLDATNFNKGIESATTAISKLQSASKSTSSFKSLSTSLERFRTELTKLESATRVSDKALNQLSENITRVGNALTVIKQFETEVNIFKKMTSAISQLKTSMQGLADISRGQLYNALYGLNNVLFRVEYHLERLSGLANGAKAFSTFANGLVKVQTSLTNFASRTGAVETGVQKMVLAFQQVAGSMSIFSTISKEVGVFNKFANGVHKISESLVRFKVATSSAATSFSTIGNAVAKYQNQLTQLQAKQEQASTSTNKVASSVKQINTTMEMASTATNMFSSSLSRLVTSANSSSTSLSTIGTKVSTTSNQLSGLSSRITSTSSSMKGLQSSASTTASSVGKIGSSASTATSGVNSLTNSVAKSSQTAKAADGRYKTLSNTLFSLRGITSMVGAMFAFNLVQGFIDSTQQSINAKSQMEAYQKTLGLSENAISSFNKKLDETVSIYQKMNKYSLGETVAGLGIEFDLSEKQMEGMMKTVARLQSEYLRAGRSAEEADLAVKDIMQGEFLRLSRETGVGKTDLMALGWSGDTKDIESLQRALDKVAEQRNWDAFAQQATSLSDVLQILKNRFGEFVADLTSVVTPGIVGAFNAISNVFQGISNWYKGSSFFTQGMTQFLGVAAAIGTLTTALIAYKGHMGLVEIAQAGFLRSLLGVTLGFNKSAIASNSAATMLKAWVAGTDTATASSMSFVGALASKVLGLNRVSVAQNGVMQTLSLMAHTTDIVKVGTTQYKESLEGLMASLAGTDVKVNLGKASLLNMGSVIDSTTYKSLSFAQKLATLNKEVGVVEASTMSTTQALKAFAGSSTAAGLAVSGVLIVALVALAAIFGSVYDNCQRTKEAVDAFHDSVENGDDYIKDASSTMNYWNSCVEQARANKEKAKEGSVEYADAVKWETEATKMADIATRDYNATLETIKHTRSVNSQLATAEEKTRLENVDALAKAYQNYGLSAEEAQQKASFDSQQALLGSDKKNKASQMYNYSRKKGTEHALEHADAIEKMSKNSESARDYLEEYSAELERTKSAWKAFDEGDMWAGLAASVGELKLWTYDWSSWMDAGLEGFMKDPLGSIGGALEGLPNYIGSWFEGLDKYTIDPIKDLLGWDELFSGEGLSDFNIGEWFNNNVSKPLSDAWNSFASDPLGSIGGAAMDFGSWLLDSIFGEGTTDVIGKAWEWFNNTVIVPLQQAWTNFTSDPIGFLAGGVAFGLETLLNSLLNNDGVDAFTSLWNWFNNSFIVPLQQAWATFASDPIGYLMSGVEFGLETLLNALLNNGGVDAFTSIWNWLNNSVILPLQQAWSQFTSDPLGYLMGVVLDLNSLLSKLIGDDPVASVWNFVNTNIIQPFSQAIQTGLANIPILGTILQMLGLIDGANGTSSQKGKTLGDMFKQAIEYVIGSIPIVGDILRMLGLIDSTTGTANQKGQNVGKNIKDGEKSGHTGTASNVLAEMGDVVNAIVSAVGQAYSAAVKVGQAIWNGINTILQRASPGFIHDQVKAEFQTDLPNAIGGATDAVYSNAQMVGQAMVDGVAPSMNTLSADMTSALSQSLSVPQLDPAVAQMLQVQGMDASVNQDALMQYQSDAMFAEQLNTTTATNTQATFTGLGAVVDNTFKGMGTSMVTAYTGMNTNQTTLLNGMQTQNKTAYTNMQNQTTTSLNNMRNQTQTVTTQMVGAWNTMKNNIVSAANQLKSESTSHFNQLSSTIGSFYRKLQNPSSWGAGDPDSTRRYSNRGRFNRGVKAVNSVFGRSGAGGKGGVKPHSSFGHHGAGSSSLVSSNTMTVKELLKMMCPNGDCLSGNQKVDVDAFLSSFTTGGFGTWGDWHPTHFNHIKSTSNEWDMKSPQIMGWIDTNTNFKVKDFLNGQPQITFAEFKSMAEALFSAIPYDFYYDSAKCGNWVAALQSGSVNCSDGADALVALAHTCGFSAYKQHGQWNGIGHFFAIVNGQKMDTTGWQKQRNWTPAASAGSPSRNMDIGNTTTNSYNVSVVIEGDVYGVDDLEEKIDDGVQKGLAEAMNTSNITGV